MRAKKFGAPLNEDLKKVARSARFGTESSENKKNNSISPSVSINFKIVCIFNKVLFGSDLFLYFRHQPS